jgi:hypothetical protein
MPDFTPEKFLVFLAFVAPGFFSMQVYSLWYPSQKREWGSSLIEIVSYSLLIYLLWSRWLIGHARDTGIVTPEQGFRPTELLNQTDLLFRGAIYIGLVTPTLLASTLFFLRCRVLPWLFHMDHPTRTAWDYAFSRNRCVFVVCTLKSGEQIGGLYGGRSYATSYPVEQELYIEQVWVIENSLLVRPIEDTKGAIIKVSECKTVEFFAVRSSEPTPTSWLAKYSAAICEWFSGQHSSKKEVCDVEERREANQLRTDGETTSRGPGGDRAGERRPGGPEPGGDTGNAAGNSSPSGRLGDVQTADATSGESTGRRTEQPSQVTEAGDYHGEREPRK